MSYISDIFSHPSLSPYKLPFQVPNLFAVDEKQEICERMRVLDRQRDRDKQTDGSPLSLFNMFVERCRTQLHVVLAMSPIGDAFRNRLRHFPALINCCTINWFQVCVCVCMMHECVASELVTAPHTSAR